MTCARRATVGNTLRVLYSIPLVALGISQSAFVRRRTPSVPGEFHSQIRQMFVDLSPRQEQSRVIYTHCYPAPRLDADGSAERPTRRRARETGRALPLYSTMLPSGRLTRMGLQRLVGAAARVPTPPLLRPLSTVTHVEAWSSMYKSIIASHSHHVDEAANARAVEHSERTTWLMVHPAHASTVSPCGSDFVYALSDPNEHTRAAAIANTVLESGIFRLRFVQGDAIVGVASADETDGKEPPRGAFTARLPDICPTPATMTSWAESGRSARRTTPSHGSSSSRSIATRPRCASAAAATTRTA